MTADEVLKNVKVPLGGDLLGRERITGAKKTRLGCDSATERFENIAACTLACKASLSRGEYYYVT